MSATSQAPGSERLGLRDFLLESTRLTPSSSRPPCAGARRPASG